MESISPAVIRTTGSGPDLQIDHAGKGWHTMPTTLHRRMSMPTRNVVVTDQQANMIERLVTSGRYQNASEVLREGLRLVERRELEDESRLEALRSAVQVGMADLEAGRYQTFESKASLKAHLKAIGNKAIEGA